jgi:hypothetical protein
MLMKRWSFSITQKHQRWALFSATLKCPAQLTGLDCRNGYEITDPVLA